MSHIIKIKEHIEPWHEVTIQPGEPLLDTNGNIAQAEKIDENGIVLDENGNTVMEDILNDTEKTVTIAVKKTEAQIEIEKKALIDAKTAEIQAKCDAYEAAKQNQQQNGGPGPVADFDIIKICNEYNGQFEVIFEE